MTLCLRFLLSAGAPAQTWACDTAAAAATSADNAAAAADDDGDTAAAAASATAAAAAAAQIDAPLNNGAWGGPVVDREGRVVGLAMQKSSHQVGRHA